MTARPSPELVARLQTDQNGDPLFVERDGQRHYRLEFEVNNVPTDVYAGTFELHPTYYDPVQTVRLEPDGRLRLNATSYGDYELKVRLRTKKTGGDIWLVDSVTHALERARGSMPATPAVDEAIAELAKH